MIEDFARKLGIKPGRTVTLLTAPSLIGPVLRAALPSEVSLDAGLSEGSQPGLVLFWPDGDTDLPQASQGPRWNIKPEGAIWAERNVRTYIHSEPI